jgi:hypothetical protein
MLKLISGPVFLRRSGLQGRCVATVRKPSVFLTNRRGDPPAAGSTQSQRSCVELYDLASVSNIVRSVSNSVRRVAATVSSNVRQKWDLIARRAVHHCASLHVVDHRGQDEGKVRVGAYALVLPAADVPPRLGGTGSRTQELLEPRTKRGGPFAFRACPGNVLGGRRRPRLARRQLHPRRWRAENPQHGRRWHKRGSRHADHHHDRRRQSVAKMSSSNKFSASNL